MASAERGELYAADVMTVYDRHEMCVWSWPCASEVPRSHFLCVRRNRAGRGELLFADFVSAFLQSLVSTHPMSQIRSL